MSESETGRVTVHQQTNIRSVFGKGLVSLLASRSCWNQPLCEYVFLDTCTHIHTHVCVFVLADGKKKKKGKEREMTAPLVEQLVGQCCSKRGASEVLTDTHTHTRLRQLPI